MLTELTSDVCSPHLAGALRPTRTGSYATSRMCGAGGRTILIMRIIGGRVKFLMANNSPIMFVRFMGAREGALSIMIGVRRPHHDVYA